ncbi:MAG TPA: DUF3006 domain-containing protein [Armatimonadota bacterium]|jgi:hypothetical protein
MQTVLPLRAFIDHIQNGVATLLLGDEESVAVSVPVSWLPSGVGEGVVLRFDISIDQQATDRGKAQVQSLFDELGNAP